MRFDRHTAYTNEKNRWIHDSMNRRIHGFINHHATYKYDQSTLLRDSMHLCADHIHHPQHIPHAPALLATLVPCTGCRAGRGGSMHRVRTKLTGQGKALFCINTHCTLDFVHVNAHARYGIDPPARPCSMDRWMLDGAPSILLASGLRPCTQHGDPKE